MYWEGTEKVPKKENDPANICNKGVGFEWAGLNCQALYMYSHADQNGKFIRKKKNALGQDVIAQFQ